jgi:hypothetical protein
MPQRAGLGPSRILLQILIGAVVAICCYIPFLYIKAFDFLSLFYLAALVLLCAAFALFTVLRRLFFKKWTSYRTWIAVIAFLCISFAMGCSVTHLRPWARWLISSASYKSQVLSQPAADPSGIRLIDWDGWGWAGSGTDVFLVYDPSDTLTSNNSQEKGKKSVEISKKAQFIQRLERNWYSATLYTNEYLSSED